MQLARRVVSSETAGYYDPRTQDLVVLSDTRRQLDAFERLTLAHELVHALADQRLGLPGKDEVEPPEGRPPGWHGINARGHRPRRSNETIMRRDTLTRERNEHP